MNAGTLKHRLTLRRLNDATKAWELIEDPHVWAAVEPQGDGRYRFRIRHRPDLCTREHIEPAMRVLYRDVEHDLDDVVEADPRREVHLIASRRIIDDINDAESGAHRIQAWPRA